MVFKGNIYPSSLFNKLVLRTDKENRLNREKSSVGPGFAREKSSVGPGFAREKSTVSRGGGAARGGKRPAWDLKGRLEDMESKFSETLARVTDLESEKRNLETDNEVKKEVVTQTHKEVVDLRQQLGNPAKMQITYAKYVWIESVLNVDPL